MTKKIQYLGHHYACRDDETVLQALMRAGVQLPFSCQDGVCHICVMRCLDGEIPEETQQGLKASLRAQNYFLPCKCHPSSDMELALPRESDLFSAAKLIKREQLGDDVARLCLAPAMSLYYHPGQFINLHRRDGVTRSYSLASDPTQSETLELHVKRVAGGELSNWLIDSMNIGDVIDIQGPQGRCYYRSVTKQEPLLLIGTGTGLAPLLGIARDALAHGHEGQIHLYHGTRHRGGLYLHDELLDMDKQHKSFNYHPCLSAEQAEGCEQGRANEVAFTQHASLAGWKCYFSGLPAMVDAAKNAALAAGVAANDIYADPFEIIEHGSGDVLTPGEHIDGDPEFTEEVRRYPDPDPEMWAALGEGKLMYEILSDFYNRVYDDPKLNPFFQHTTKQRSIEKQFSFLNQVFTGNNVYFGERPRNAHHWMVISDEIFDYRENLMETVLREHGLADHLVRRWLSMENSYRDMMVKKHAWPKIVEGVVFPLEGYEELVMEFSSLCDSCQKEINVGDKVRYHVRLGTTYCEECVEQANLDKQ